jgi:hypothetical protein
MGTSSSKSSKSSYFNLFEDEEVSLENLRIWLVIPVGFNSAKDIDPWHPSLMEIKNGKQFPEWVNKYFEGYK